MMRKLERSVDALSLAFLLLPNLVFAWGWLQPWFALVLSAGVLFLAFAFLKWRFAQRLPDAGTETALTWPCLIACFVLAAIWVALSGVGGMGFQNSDYVKHNGIFSDLLLNPWPVHYKTTFIVNNEPRFLVYALAHYLPAALIGKATSWHFANRALYLWDVIGATLALLWVVRIAGLKRWQFVLLFPILSGLDVLGSYIVKGSLPNLGDHIEWWEGYVQFSSNSTMLFWVPQHAIAGWIAAAMLSECVRMRNAMMALVPLTFIAIWSPLVMMGMTPFFLVSFAYQDLRGKVSIPIIVASIAVFLFVVPFFAANDMRFPLGFFVGFDGKATTIATLVLFYAIEFLVFAWPVSILIKVLPKPERVLLNIAFVCLALFPLYKLGAAHDLAMRGSISALFLLWCFVLRALNIGNYRAFAYQLLVVAIAIGSFTPFSEMARSVRFYTSEPPAADAVKSIAVLGQDEFVDQYLGRDNTFFFKYLARPLAEQP